jgi:hypothetical protein
MPTSVIKTAIWLLVIVELWLLVQVPSVGNAIFSFVVGGEMPGTDKILSMRDMMLFLTGLFILVLSLVFRKEINAALNTIGKSRRSAPLSDSQDQKTKETPTAVAQPKPVTRLSGRKAINPLVRGFLKLSSIGWRTLLVLFGFVRNSVLKICMALAFVIFETGKASSLIIMRFWRFVRPYIEQYDRWLDRKLHQSEEISELLHFGSEMSATTKDWLVRLRTLSHK